MGQGHQDHAEVKPERENFMFNHTRRDILLGTVFIVSMLPALAQAKPKIGIVGAGRMGGGLGRLWANAGYQVMLSARDPGPVKTLAADIGHGAKAGTPQEAAAFGDVVLISVPYGALPAMGKELAPVLKGKIVLDTCNPYVGRDGPMAQEAIDRGTGVMDPIYLPGVRLVRAFNQVNYLKLAPGEHKQDGETIGIPLASDDKQALATAARLVRDAGFEPVVVGGLASARRFDVGSDAYHTLPAGRLRAILGVK
jgi:predicted dinucleotide-binding enzyme